MTRIPLRCAALVAVALAALAGCDAFGDPDADLGVTPPGYEPRVAVDGYLFAGRPPRLTLYRTSPAWNGAVSADVAAQNALAGARVVLAGPDGEATLRETAPGVYEGDTPVRPGATYDLRVEAPGVPVAQATVRVPTGTPRVGLSARYEGATDAAVSGTGLVERVHRLEWTAALPAGDAPRHYVVLFKRESWDGPTEEVRLVRTDPGASASATFSTETAVLLPSAGAPDPTVGREVARYVVAAEVDPAYFRRLQSERGVLDAGLPSNVRGGSGLLAALAPDSLRAAAVVGSNL